MGDAAAQIDAPANQMASLLDEFEVGPGDPGVGPVPATLPLSIEALQQQHPNVRRILQIQVPVVIKLAEGRRPVSELMQMRIGSILEFDKPFDAPLELLIASRPIGYGQAVKAGEKLGLRILKIGPVQQTLAALAPELPTD
jgi:flagellar motor switch/type III secretory pathway protein FliN